MTCVSLKRNDCAFSSTYFERWERGTMGENITNDAILDNTVPAQNQLNEKQSVMVEGPVKGNGIRIMFVGNSITRHAPKIEIGWEYDWGMAASSLENDYVHRIMKKVSSQCVDAVYCIAQMAEWERQYRDSSEILKKYSDMAEFDPDIIIMRIAENVLKDGWEEHSFISCYEQLIDYLNSNHKAKVIITTSFWPAGPIDEAIRKVAKKRDYQLVELGFLGVQDEMKALGLFEHKGVAAHPGDAGMAAIANAIWEPLQNLLSNG